MVLLEEQNRKSMHNNKQNMRTTCSPYTTIEAVRQCYRNKQKMNAYLIAILVTFLLIDISDACSCSFDHPQFHACKADFVIAATFQRSSKISEYEVAYKFRLRKIFKASPEAEALLKYGKILAPSEESMCGLYKDTFEPKQTYLVTGRVSYGRENFNSHICTVPHTKLLHEKNYKQAHIEKYIKQHGCQCEISKRSRRKFTFRGLQPINKTESLCHIEKYGEKQIVRGTVKTMKLVMNLCNYNRKWQHLTKRQQKGFKKLYYYGCDCELEKTNSKPESEQSKLGCPYSISSVCTLRNGICMPDKNGLCNWSQSISQEECWEEWRASKRDQTKISDIM
ncbi:metalloproteinase inhibitor 4 isoform X2 [Chrysoperla carnea]|nr:metalloproteinase inhibitor 4 isoform X2 [Chrysoperla carnea]XP_044734800.1 metalloproteinase inhibitor 4 isoform X2 [Chrysoperla carnea]